MLLTAELHSRRPSRAARAAFGLAVFLPVLAGLSVLGHRGGLIDTPTFLALAAVCAAICLVGLILFAIGLRSLWVHGTAGGRRLSWALFLFLPFLVLYCAATLAYLARPVLSDVSTDLIDPPLFVAEIEDNETADVARVAGQLREGYPELLGARFRAPLDATSEVVSAVATQLRWRPVGRRGRVGADNELFFEFRYRTPVLAMPVDIVVRAVDEGETTFIDARSRMADLPHDLGVNAWIIGRFQADLDYAMIGVAEP